MEEANYKVNCKIYVEFVRQIHSGHPRHVGILRSFECTLMVSNGWPDTTQHTPPNPPARKFFTPEVLLFCFFGDSTTASSCSAILLMQLCLSVAVISRHES